MTPIREALFDLLAVDRGLLNGPQWLQQARHNEPLRPFNPARLNRARLE
jgi:hypothetical protein